MKEKLLSRIAERKITVGVVGLGYVGLPLAVEKAKAGFRTIGFDVQEEKVNLVNAGHNYIGDVVDAELAQLLGGYVRHSAGARTYRCKDYPDLCGGYRERKAEFCQ